MKKDKMKSKNTDYSCDDYDDFFEDDIAETESDYDDISDFEPPRCAQKGGMILIIFRTVQYMSMLFQPFVATLFFTC